MQRILVIYVSFIVCNIPLGALYAKRLVRDRCVDSMTKVKIFGYVYTYFGVRLYYM